MKCIVYVSKVATTQDGMTVPVGLAKLVRESQKRNLASGVSGILSYRKGYYFQLIEGENSSVDALYAKIKVDPRHRQIEMILETQISKITFPDFGMRLHQSIDKSIEARNFISRHAAKLNAVTPSQKALLELFIKIDLKAINTTKAQSYQNSELILTAWPDFNILQTRPKMTQLCARLTKKAQPYKALLSSGEFGSRVELDDMLNTFQDMNILKIVSTGRASSSSYFGDNTDSFYSKMRDFLGLR